MQASPVLRRVSDQSSSHLKKSAGLTLAARASQQLREWSGGTGMPLPETRNHMLDDLSGTDAIGQCNAPIGQAAVEVTHHDTNIGTLSCQRCQHFVFDYAPT